MNFLRRNKRLKFALKSRKVAIVWHQYNRLCHALVYDVAVLLRLIAKFLLALSSTTVNEQQINCNEHTHTSSN